MPKKIRKKVKKKNYSRLLLFFLFLVLGVLILFQFFLRENSKIAQTDGLQLGTFQPTQIPPANNPQITKLPSNSPTPTIKQQEVCAHDTGEKVSETCACPFLYVVCENNRCKDVRHDQSGLPVTYGCEEVDKNNWCNTPYADEGDGNYCLAKPIIYLYPEIPTFVDVRVESIGKVVISDPLYPTGGWKQVLAYPNGNLSYQGKQYRDLFYETDVEDFQKPTEGINIPREKIESELARILTRLGLSEFEKKEFMDFWVPILQDQDKPHIQFSLIQGKAKDEIDRVIITPKPDTFIEILAYFKPLDKPFQGPSLLLPENPPIRKGFTAVEWGGVIDNK